MDPVFRIVGPTRAPVVIMCNSLGSSSAIWDSQVEFLSQKMRVVTLEQRGHGGTQPPCAGPYTIADLGSEVLSVINAVGEERVSICGLSLGGMVAMWIAANHPQRVSSLVLACTSAYFPNGDSWLDRAEIVRSEGTLSLLEVLLGRWFTPGFLVGHPEIRDLASQMLGSVDDEGYAGCCEAIGEMDQRASLSQITARTLVIAGEFDPVTPPRMAMDLKEAISGAAMVVIRNAAHLANLEQPELFNSALGEHFRVGA